MRTLVSALVLTFLVVSPLAFSSDAYGLRRRTGDAHTSRGSVQRDETPALPDVPTAPEHDAFAAHLAGGRTTRGMVEHRDLLRRHAGL